MNDVFLLMWLADIAGGISFMGGAAFIAMLLGLIIMGACKMFEEDVEYAKCAKVLLWCLVPVLLAVLAPSQNTVRLLAAAKAGEVLSKTETGAKSIEAVNAVLDKIIATAKKD